MNDRYEDFLNQKLDRLSPGVSADLANLGEYPPEVRQGVVETLLAFACESSHARNITLARDALATIAPAVLGPILNGAIRSTVDLTGEWEYRRLLEMLRFLDSELLPAFIERGLHSTDDEIREAAEDFALAPLLA